MIDASLPGTPGEFPGAHATSATGTLSSTGLPAADGIDVGATGLASAAVPPGVKPSPLIHLASPEGVAAIAGLMRSNALFAFDFDGTLAPIRPRPADVHVSATIALRLQRLAKVRPVAIVTGRQIADVRDRLGFTPTWIVGNHGAEDDGDAEAGERAARALDGLRRRLLVRADGLAAAGVMVEDKIQSLALHFRTAPDREAASTLIQEVLAGFTPALHVFGGKLVYNAVSAEAADKAVAVRRLLARAGADVAFFVGDDVNDEPVFAAALRGWVTVRIGCGRRDSAARFCIDGPQEMAYVLDRMLAPIDEGAAR